MLNLLYIEILKLKRSKLFMVSLLGAMVVPVMIFFMLTSMRARNPQSIITFENYFRQTDMFILLMIGTLLFGLLTTYVFNREYQEETLKNLLTIPVGRKSLIISKLLVVLMVILALMLFSFLLTLILGLIGHFEELSVELLIRWGQLYLYSGLLLFLLTPSVILITLLFKNYIAAIGFTIAVSVVSIIVAQSEYVLIYPWTVPGVIALPDLFVENEKFTMIHSWVSLGLTFILPLTASIIYFEKTDIN